MKQIIELSATIVQMFIWVWFIRKFFTPKFSGTDRIFALITVAIVCAEVSFMNKIMVYEGLLSVIILLTIIIYSHIFLKGSLVMHVFINIYAISVIFSVSSMLIFIASHISGINTEGMIIDLTLWRFIMIIICRVLEFLIFSWVIKINAEFEFKKSEWLIFIGLPLVTYIATTIITNATIKSPEIISEMLCVAFLLVAINIAICFFMVKIKKVTLVEKREEVYSQQIKSQAKHLDEILVSQTEMRKLRHDLSNHFITLKAYFEEGDSKKGIEYIDSIKSETSVRKKMIDTGNISLDAIINTKRSIAEKNGIEFVCNIQIPENIFLDPIDVCVIFGNALDNAIEACSRVKKDKKIAVSIVYENDSLICKIVNAAVKTENDFLQTGKADKKNHGFGIGNIKSALDKYKNVCRFEQNENEFILSFVVFKR